VGLVTNASDSSLDLSSYAFLGNRCVWWSVLRFSDISSSVEYCRFHGVMAVYTLVQARKSLYVLLFVQGAVGTWILLS